MREGSARNRGCTAALACLLLGLMGCAGGMGGAASEPRGMLPARWTAADGQSQEVPFSFAAFGDGEGSMITTLGRGGEHFQGSYLRVANSTKGHLVTEVYNGFSSPEWQEWEHGPDGGWTATATSFGDFAHFYTGKVVATLRGTKGSAMRCRFTLAVPEGGLLEGGEGQCQISDGGRVDLKF